MLLIKGDREYFSWEVDRGLPLPCSTRWSKLLASTLTFKFFFQSTIAPSLKGIEKRIHTSIAYRALLSYPPRRLNAIRKGERCALSADPIQLLFFAMARRWERKVAHHIHCKTANI